MRRRVVIAALGREAVEGRCDDYVEGLFDGLMDFSPEDHGQPIVPRPRSPRH